MSDEDKEDNLELPRSPLSIRVTGRNMIAFRTTKLTDDKPSQQAFLDRMSRTGLFSHAAEAAGYCSQSFRNLMKADTEFDALVQEARATYVERLERVADVRGFEGHLEVTSVIEEGCDDKGKPYLKTKISKRNIVSDQLAITRLKALDPERYRDNVKVDQTIRGGVLVVKAPFATDAEMEAEMKRVAERQAALKKDSEAKGY
jgi:hypothetical protein